MIDARESRLPLWARTQMAQLRQGVKELEAKHERLKAAHAVLMNREWFAINGPHSPQRDASGRVNESYHLWFLDRDCPLSACVLAVGDVLLVGRKQQETAK